jgi:DHA1 family multidrug resistance protein-like MFS transporter
LSHSRWLPLAVALAVCGAAGAMRTIAVPLFVTRELGGSTAAVGLVVGLTTATAIVVELNIGRRSDRFARRFLFIAAVAAWVALGFAAASWVGSVWALLPFAPLFFAFAGVPTSQLLSVGRLRLTGANSRLAFSSLRACFSVGFALGPAIVAPFLGAFGPRRALWLISGCWLVSAVLALLANDRQPAPAVPPRDAPRWRPGLLPLMAGFILILSVDCLRSAFVTVYADRELRAPTAMIPFVFTASSLLNLVFMPLSGALADRIGAGRVVVACACLGAVAALGTALVTSGWQLLGLQFFHAAYTGGVLSVGLSLMQDQFPGRPALGASLYSIGFALSHVLSGLLGGVIGKHAGLRPVFAGAAAAAIIGALLVRRATARSPDAAVG